MTSSLDPAMQARKQVIDACVKKYNILHNRVWRELLPLNVIPDTPSKKLALLLMVYKREVTSKDLAKISTQAASSIRDLADDGFLFKRGANSRSKSYEYRNASGERCRQIIGFAESKLKIKGLAKSLLEKSVAACISAIEIYNKPDFKYREELFAILAVNAWELLLKTKIVFDNGNSINSIWDMDKKTGAPIIRNGIHQTIGIYTSLQRLNSAKILDKDCCTNLECLIEIRNASTHFVNKSRELAQSVQEIGTANLLNYVTAASEWFNKDLSSYSFFLMPMSFFYPVELEKALFSKHPKEVSTLLHFLEGVKAASSLGNNSKYKVFQKVMIDFTRSEARESDLIAKMAKASEASEAVSVKMEEESLIEKYYPLDYGKIINVLKKNIQGFKVNNKFHRIMKKLEGSGEEYCKFKYLNHITKTGTHKKWYSPKILEELYKHYS